jgi:amidase
LEPAIQKIEAVLGSSEDTDVATEGFTALYWAMRYIQGQEAWIVDGPMIERLKPPLGPGVADRFEFSRAVTERQVTESQAIRSAFRERLAALLGRDGVLVLPSMPDVAPLLSESDEALNDYRNKALNLQCLSVLSGCPQVSIPLAFRENAPLGISILGPAGSDLSLIRLAARIADGSASA